MDNRQHSNRRLITTTWNGPNSTDQFIFIEERNLNKEKVWNKGESSNEDDVISPLFGIIDWAIQTKTYSKLIHKLSTNNTSYQEIY